MTNNLITGRDLRLGALFTELAVAADQPQLSCTLDAAIELCAKCPTSGDLEERLRSAAEILTRLSASEEIMQIGAALARLSVPDEEVRVRNCKIFATRYGAVDIGERPTLEALSVRYGMTRERVRQIIEKMLSKLAGKTLWTPVCNEAIASSTYVHMSAHLIDAFANFAWDVLATRIRVEKLKVRGRAVGGDPVLAQFTADANSVSQRLISRNGAAQAHLTYSTAARLNPDRAPPSFDQFYDALSKTPDLIWLDKPTGWYAFKDDLVNAKQNRIRSQVLKMLACVQKTLDVEEAFAQLARYRERGALDTDENPMASIPYASLHSSVLKSLLMHLPEVTYVGHDDFVLASDKDSGRIDFLSDVERQIYDVMASNGGLASRAQVRKALVETNKIKHAAFTVTWERSPVFAAVERGICRLVGWTIDVPALEEARCTVNA